MAHFNQFRKFKPNVLDKLISKIKPLGKLLNTDSYAMNVFNQAIKEFCAFFCSRKRKIAKSISLYR